MWLCFVYNYENNVSEAMLIICRKYRGLEDVHECPSDL
jgi:hypothetical protein